MSESSKAASAGRPTDDEIMRAAPPSARGKEVRVGIFVLVGILSFVVVLFMLTDPATFRGRYLLVTTVEHAGGVRRGDPIQLRGVNVGRVSGFEMMENGGVAITLELEGEWTIPRGSTTRMGASGIFGGRTIEIVPAPDGPPLEQGDTLPGESGDAGGLLGSAEELGEQAGTVLERITTLLDTTTISSVQASAGDLAVLLKELSATVQEERSAIRSLAESLNRSASGLEQAAAAGPDVARAIVRADSAMATLAATGENLDRATVSLRSVLDRMERGEGTLGRLSQDAALYDNLNRAASSLNVLLEDLRTNPGKYINLSIF
jgi:phospholipid/cholesterol/gamma-HCH transport system substrate-binding protein